MNETACTNWQIAGGRVIDPASGSDTVGDLYVIDGRISAESPSPNTPFERLDAAGCIVCPGLVDIHTHLRDPGHPEAETLLSGTAAAARGGFTTVVAMPNTQPPLDTAERVASLAQRAATAAQITVLPCGCLTLERTGAKAVDLEGLKAAGAVAFSDDGTTPLDEILLSDIARTAKLLELPILDHAEDIRCSGDGVMHAGERSRALGLPGIPEEAEILAVGRDIRIADQTGCSMHIQHVSCARTVTLIRQARSRGIPVSAEVTPHHLAFCDDDVVAGDARFKMNPPLRSARDREALREAVIDGTASVLATDHAPHTAQAKARGFLEAPFGVTGLETAAAVTYTLLVVQAGMPLVNWLRRWTTGPLRVLGLPPPRITPGEAADIMVFDPNALETVDSSKFLSRSANSPFVGKTFQGCVRATMVRGKLVWRM